MSIDKITTAIGWASKMGLFVSEEKSLKMTILRQIKFYHIWFANFGWKFWPKSPFLKICQVQPFPIKLQNQRKCGFWPDETKGAFGPMDRSRPKIPGFSTWDFGTQVQENTLSLQIFAANQTYPVKQ